MYSAQYNDQQARKASIVCQSTVEIIGRGGKTVAKRPIPQGFPF
jgi:hypothetical protein